MDFQLKPQKYKKNRLFCEIYVVDFGFCLCKKMALSQRKKRPHPIVRYERFFYRIMCSYFDYV